MGLLSDKSITVTLHEQSQDGADELNRDTYTVTDVEVPGVLVAPASESEITETLNLYGRRAVYKLALPKGDTHTWVGCTVDFFDRTWAVIGDVTMGIEDLVPTEWHKIIRVEAVNG